MSMIVLLLVLMIFGSAICWLVGRRTPATYLEDVGFGLVLAVCFILTLIVGGHIAT
jgi:VIT1/CCC1 family predicted Fe2+/Mn2+ transporter